MGNLTGAKENSEKGKFFCILNKHYAPMSDLKKGTLTLKGTGKCRSCHNEYSRNHIKTQMAESNPQNYLTCCDCDQFFSKYKNGRTRKCGNQPENKCCPYCKSTNMEPYLEQ